MLCGVLLRSWAAGIIHKGKTLATTGPYAFTRHPLYTGSFLIAIGICIITKDNTLIWLLFGIIFMIYLLKIYCEELTLADRFGKEWHEYTNTVAMFLPKRLPLRLHASWSLSQWIQNREYCVCITCVVVLVIFEILHRF
jgi:protein-S-isoprenylcysteine O-methyltransferase Ste14